MILTSLIKSNSVLTYAQKSILLVSMFTIIRVVLSCFLELGNDESYYWTYSQHLQWNYFDHPPMVAVFIKFTTLGLWLQEHVFFLRLGSFIGCIAGSYFMYKTIANISNDKAAFFGVFIYNCSFYASISAGLLITPDAPQMVFWTASLYCITKIIHDQNSTKYWILFGISTGLAIMSKVHAIFLWEGMFLYMLFYKRTLFSQPFFYISALVTAVIISPILFWNINNDFITYRFHSARVVNQAIVSINWFGLLKEILGQLIINNPFNIAFVILFFKANTKKENTVSSLTVFKLIALPLLVIIFAIALFRATLPHWSGPAYITLIPLAAIGLSNITFSKYAFILKAAMLYFLLFITAIIYCVNFYPGTFGSKSNLNLGKNDISVDAYGWKQAGEKFALLYNAKEGNKQTTDKPPLVCNTWWGAHEEYYFAMPLGIKMIGLGTTQELHNYAWKNKFDLINTKMDTAYCIVHSDDYYDVRKVNNKYYKTIDSIATIVVLRNNKPAHNFYIYRFSNYR
jgi:hypothetical protein